VIAFLTICYLGLVWLVFLKLELLPWNRGSQGAVAGVGIFGVLALVIAMNLFQPFSQDVRVYRPVVQIVPRVTGRVVEVAAQKNEAVSAGDVLFRIDPEPYQYEVDRLAATLELKRIVRDDAAALTGAQVLAQIKYDRAQAEFESVRAQLDGAQVDLRETVAYAPSDGVVTNLALRPGQIASQMASLPVMTVVEDSPTIVIATFSQSALKYVEVDDEVEIAFDRQPGRIVAARVGAIIPATGQGQLPPSGVLMQWTDSPVPGRMGVALELASGNEDLELPAGSSGVAAVYTDRATAIRIIRRVVMRMNTWLNYVIL
jgi:multidrug resistance efflux pump